MKSLYNNKKYVILTTAELINGDTLYRRLSNSKGIEPYCLKQNLPAGSTLPGDNFVNLYQDLIKICQLFLGRDSVLS